MPEYLAPGVYVEETSFRSKSIEGVSTSTTAFVGPTRRGPYYDPQQPSPLGLPELLTSFADYERIYGGLGDLAIGPNYMAHAVKGYFDNGGARLYVSRAFAHNASSGLARSAPLVDLADDTRETRFVARTPGSAGNGAVALRQVESPATLRSIGTAPSGSLLRIGGGGTPAQPASLEGAFPPFALPNGGTLLLTAGGTAVELEVHGEPVSVTGAAIATPDAVAIAGADAALALTVDDIPQRITFAPGTMTVAEIVAAINRQLRSGFAEVTGGNRITIGSDRRGRRAEVSVEANATLGFAAATAAHGTDVAANNVDDLLAVTADEINSLLVAEGAGVRAAQSPTSNRLVLTTTDTGEDATLAVGTGTDAENAVAQIFGFDVAEEDEGEDGATLRYYVKTGNTWLDRDDRPLALGDFAADGTHPQGADLLTLSMVVADADGTQIAYEGLGFAPAHPRWVGNVLSAMPARRSDALQNPFAIQMAAATDPFELRESLFATGDERMIALGGGSDGVEPNAAAYAAALQALEQIDDISIVAAPGSSAYHDAQGIMNEMITHVEKRRMYRIAVLDTPPGQALSEARATRSKIDSTRAALYYPWLRISNPLARPGDDSIPAEIVVPPSGHICGIYARNDNQHGVFKAPANEVVFGALGFETDINMAQQEVLNPLGVNCLRFFPGRGYRVWGARTASSDPEWKYVNIRRYFNYLERSIDVGTQWAVFEPNGERLWANIRDTVESFLYNEWVSGALLGANPKEAFFVRCDRSTMTQNDLDNGRLICLIGVAAVKPAEFVIFRIGQKTAEARA